MTGLEKLEETAKSSKLLFNGIDLLHHLGVNLIVGDFLGINLRFFLRSVLRFCIPENIDEVIHVIFTFSG